LNINSQTKLISTKSGLLEAVVDQPRNPLENESRGYAILSHPHPLHGGTMENKVVQTMARAFAYAGWTVIRFNFRGVGKSEGTFDHAVGETEDLLNIISELAPDGPISLGGFSFGAAVTCRAVEKLKETRDIRKIVLVGLAVSRFEAPEIDTKYQLDTLVLHGEDDDTVDLQSVMSWAKPQVLPVTVIPQTGHFFHGQLSLLKGLILRHVNSTEL
jgi:alpha/beta superfamily hydrolase